MPNALVLMSKRLIKGLFGLFGLRVSRISKVEPTGSDRYFNKAYQTPLDENSRELYDRFYADRVALEEYYDTTRLALYSEISQRAKENGVVLDDKDVIDVGCGTGHLLAEFRRWAKPRSMTGCDFSEEGIRFSRERFPGCRFFRHDIYEPLPDSYDVLLCTEVLEHLEYPVKAIRNLINATRRGGVIIITVPNGRLDHLNEHINFWSPESWKVFVEKECPECASVCFTINNGYNNLAILNLPS